MLRGRVTVASIASRMAIPGRPFAKLILTTMLLFVLASNGFAQELFPPPESPEQWITQTAIGGIRVDGRLDEPAWDAAVPVDEFIQKDPLQGEPASYRTVVRVLYDDDALYISAYCEQPRDTIRVQNLERDFSFGENDLFGVAIDGFLDRRNAVAFQVTPRGNQRDLEVIDGTDFNSDWNARWDVRTRIEDDHWTVEMAIPWRTIRYLDGTDRLGVIFARNIRHLNERTAAPPVPRALTIYRMAYQGELVELDTPSPSANVQVNPYALVDYSDSRTQESDFEMGGEVKWAITPSTVLDVTVNTDFAQAEVDRQVVNLERFSVFFPERRQFFLENANLFNASVTNWIRPFFSRRIGLDDFGNPIPLDGGLRLTSRNSRQELGVLVMSQQEAGLNPASMYGVARYSRNLAGQSRLGGMFTVRRDDEALIGDAAGQTRDNFTYTIDGLWRPSQAVGVQAMVSASHDDIVGNGIGAQLWAFYENNWLYAGLLEYYNKDYEPGVGLEILDTNYVMHSPAVSLDLRPEQLPASIRSFNPGAEAYIFQSSDDGDLLFAYAPIRPLRFFFQDGAQIGLTIEPNWQRLEEPFFPAGIEVAPGRYDYTRYRVNWESDQSASLGGGLSVESGNYFDGELTTYSASARYAPFPELEMSADVDINRIRSLGVAAVDDDTRVLGMSVRVAPTPQLQFRVLYQQNSVGDRDNWNARLSWEYRPLSFIYLVYNRNEISGLNTDTSLNNEQVILKMTYLFEV
ncbi:MAG: DUF5916 domain-containing protein [Woeseiaceae bacterium]|nr:DUF5916 domain-containing protein [Woeseiaceae bacterium]